MLLEPALGVADSLYHRRPVPLHEKVELLLGHRDQQTLPGGTSARESNAGEMRRPPAIRDGISTGGADLTAAGDLAGPANGGRWLPRRWRRLDLQDRPGIHVIAPRCARHGRWGRGEGPKTGWALHGELTLSGLISLAASCAGRPSPRSTQGATPVPLPSATIRTLVRAARGSRADSS